MAPLKPIRAGRIVGPALVLALAAVDATAADAGSSGVIGPEALIAQACTGCHLAEQTASEVTAGTVPVLLGRDAVELRRLMQRFKDEQRGTVMGRIMAGYTEQEIQQLAAYFARSGR